MSESRLAGNIATTSRQTDSSGSVFANMPDCPPNPASERSFRPWSTKSAAPAAPISSLWNPRNGWCVRQAKAYQATSSALVCRLWAWTRTLPSTRITRGRLWHFPSAIASTLLRLSLRALNSNPARPAAPGAARHHLGNQEFLGRHACGQSLASPEFYRRDWAARFRAGQDRPGQDRGKDHRRRSQASYFLAFDTPATLLLRAELEQTKAPEEARQAWEQMEKRREEARKAWEASVPGHLQGRRRHRWRGLAPAYSPRLPSVPRNPWSFSKPSSTTHGKGLISSGIISLVRSDASVAELYLQVMQNAGTATTGEVMGLFGQDPSLSAAFLSGIAKTQRHAAVSGGRQWRTGDGVFSNPGGRFISQLRGSGHADPV